ncbi:MAG: DUF7689 domain-containing protein [Planctomycetota bacterium]|jgi:hypothetical protein
MNAKELLMRDFPRLRKTPFQVTSPDDPSYNCVAWVLGDTKNWWEPDPWGEYYWPPGIPRNYALRTYQAMFESFGYSVANEDDLESGGNNVAIFAKLGHFKHVALQLDSERWTSKLGRDEDIEHPLGGLVGELYGGVKIILKK